MIHIAVLWPSGSLTGWCQTLSQTIRLMFFVWSSVHQLWTVSHSVNWWTSSTKETWPERVRSARSSTAFFWEFDCLLGSEASQTSSWSIWLLLICVAEPFRHNGLQCRPSVVLLLNCQVVMNWPFSALCLPFFIFARYRHERVRMLTAERRAKNPLSFS